MKAELETRLVGAAMTLNEIAQWLAREHGLITADSTLSDYYRRHNLGGRRMALAHGLSITISEVSPGVVKIDVQGAVRTAVVEVTRAHPDAAPENTEEGQPRG